MKKALGIVLILIIMCTAGCGNNYTDYPVYQLENTGMDSYTMMLADDKVFKTLDDTRWYPASIDNDTILGTCDYNGTVLIHSTSSEICVFISNIDSTRKPSEYLYREDAILPEINASKISKIRYVAYEGLHTSDSLEKVITNTAQIEKVISVLENKTEYIELDWNDPEIEQIGIMNFYCDELIGMEASLRIISYNDKNYFVVKDETDLICVDGSEVIPLEIVVEK